MLPIGTPKRINQLLASHRDNGRYFNVHRGKQEGIVLVVIVGVHPSGRVGFRKRHRGGSCDWAMHATWGIWE